MSVLYPGYPGDSWALAVVYFVYRLSIVCEQSEWLQRAVAHRNAGLVMLLMLVFPHENPDRIVLWTQVPELRESLASHQQTFIIALPLYVFLSCSSKPGFFIWRVIWGLWEGWLDEGTPRAPPLWGCHSGPLCFPISWFSLISIVPVLMCFL